MHPELYAIVYRQQERELECALMVRRLQREHGSRIVHRRATALARIRDRIAAWRPRPAPAARLECCPACCAPA